jgi:transposase-like protein
MIDPARLLSQALSDASPDLMRHLLGTVINALLSADADAVCGAEYGLASPDRVNSRNGYRRRELDTRVGTIDVAAGPAPRPRPDHRSQIMPSTLRRVDETLGRYVLAG